MVKKMAIATPYYNHQGWAMYNKSMFETLSVLLRMTTMTLDYWIVPGDSYVWRARNMLSRKLLESGFHEVFFIDSDMQWDVRGLINVLLRDEPVVGAAYPVKNNWGSWTSMPGEGGGMRKDGGISANNGIVSAGFCKIQRDVFETLAKEREEDYYITQEGIKEYNFFGHIFENHRPYGEDVSFCLRCREAGIPLTIEPDVTITHWGVNGWEGNYLKSLKDGGQVLPI